MNKAITFTALWVALAGQTFWIVSRILHHHGLESTLYPLFVVVGFAALAATHARYRWIAAVLRIFIGLAFLGSVGDRLGLLGGPGKPGVSWGNFENFTTYTGQVNSFLPMVMIPALAMIESTIEGILGLGMLFGVGLRITVSASSALLFAFGIAMTASLGIESQFPFAVFVLATGAWVLSIADTSFLSMDGILVRLWRKLRGHRWVPHVSRFSIRGILKSGG